jgi:hypothetical protein
MLRLPPVTIATLSRVHRLILHSDARRNPKDSSIPNAPCPWVVQSVLLLGTTAETRVE